MRPLLIMLVSIICFNSNAQSLNALPDTLYAGQSNYIYFSGTAINAMNDSCVIMVIKQGTQVLYTSNTASSTNSGTNTHYPGSNVFVSNFFIATNTILNNVIIEFYNICNNTTVKTYSNIFKSTSSKILSIIENLFDVTIFPNPATQNDVNVNISNTVKARYQLNLLNNQGKLVNSKLTDSEKNTINTESLSTGVYFLEVINTESGHKTTRRLQVP